MRRATDVSDVRSSSSAHLAQNVRVLEMLMKREASDRRTRRTQQRLRDALIDLILERGYAAVTVQDVLDRADVGRSTFYSHFYDKEDLLLSGFEDPHWVQGAHLGSADDKSLSLGFFAHAAQHYRLYRALVGQMAGEQILSRAQHVFEAAMETKLSSLEAKGVALPPREGLAQALAGALLGMLRWWLDSEMPLPAEEMDRRFHRLAMGSLGHSSEAS